MKKKDNISSFVSKRDRCFIIAEAGSNHNGSLDQAKRMIDVASEAGADAVKFQIFRAKTMYPDKPIEVKYLKKLGVKDNLYNIIKKSEVPYSWIKELSAYAKMKKIELMATPFDLEAVRELNPYVRVFKVASYESLFTDLICEIKKTKKTIFISTGGCTEEEIDLLIDKVLHDYLDKTVLLHCIAKYPAPLEQLNLCTMPYFSKKYDVAVGYSDHTKDPIIAPVSAVVLGAKVIEKHFTLSRNLSGSDHMFAVEPDELKAMIKAIRNAEKTVGKASKRILNDCEKELYYYKRCAYCKNDLPKGKKLKKGDLKVLRNVGQKCNYVNPIEIDKIIGKKLTCDKKEGDIIAAEELV